MYKTIIQIDDNGIVNRKDNNGNTFTYNLSDVSHVKYDSNSGNNAIVVLKKGKKVKGIVEGKIVESDINVIAFYKKADCDKTIELLKKITGSKE